MKREGKQHGMVRTYLILPKPGTRFVTQFDSPPTAGAYTKVPSKPTNHSKFTGKCSNSRCTGCRVHPLPKPRSKPKESFKHFQAMDHGLKFIGLSATGTLNHISKWYVDDDDYDDDDDDDVEDESVVDHMNDAEDESVVDHVNDVEDETVVDHVDDVKDESVVEQDDDDEVEDAKNSCTLDEKEVEYPLRVGQVKEEKYEDEDWCLVEIECCS